MGVGKAVTAEDIPTGYGEAFQSLFNTLSRLPETQDRTVHETLQLINHALENYDFEAALQALITPVTKSKV
jgi:hypothetical protein